MRLLPAILLLAIASSSASAQLGASFHIRSVSGDETDSANSDRRGYEFRLHYDRALTQVVALRADVAAIQMQYQRDIPALDRRQVSENGAEVALLATAEVPAGALTGVYALGGPVASWRLNCGASGGFVDCDATPSQQIGYAIGLGYRSPITERRDLLFEVKFADRVVGGAGAPVVSIGVGIRARQPISRD